MTVTPKSGVRVVGLIFLALGLFKLLTGGAWVVWIILGVLFGGLSTARRLEDPKA